MLETAFTLRGHHTDTYERGLDFLDAFKGQEKLPYDLLLVDLMLPGGLSGLETVQSLRQMMPSTSTMPVIFITGAGHVEVEHARATMPSAPIILKPFHYAEVLKIVEQEIARARATPEQ